MPVHRIKGAFMGLEMQDGTFYCYGCTQKEALDLDPKNIKCALGSRDGELRVTVCDRCSRISFLSFV